MSDRPTFKIGRNEKYITSQLLTNIIESDNLEKVYLEEGLSELWYESKGGAGKIQFKNNITYEGFMQYGILDNNNPNEKCTITFPEGTKYIGTLKNNEITGEGKYIFEDGSTYEGSVLDGLRHGKGIFKSNNGIYYEGEWSNGLKNGKGKIIQGNMELEGEWINDILNGKCRIKWKSGNLFDGKLENNKMNGNGYMIWYNKNEKYTGMWKDNLQNGYGIHIWYDSKNENKFFRNRYVGEWKEGKRNGYGRFYYSNGNIYEGQWKNNKKEGFGILYYNDRTKYVGAFKNDNILEVNERKKKEDPKKNNKNIKDRKINKINQNIDEIKLNISINDIINSEEKNMKSLKELDNLILRNLSVITHLYLYECGKEEIKAMDINFSTLASNNLNESKINRLSRRNTKTGNENNNNNLKQSDSQTFQTEKKVEKIIDYDNVCNNDLYFCLDFNDFWKLIRECGLITENMSLAMINRILFQNPDNNIDMFYIPDILIKEYQKNCNEEEKEKIYNYIYYKIKKSKIDFENKYKEQIKKSYSLIYGNNNIENDLNKENEEMSKDIEKYIIDFGCHEGKNIILLRYFYEIIIRLAYIKYNDPKMTLFSKTKKLLDEMKSFLKAKMKSGNSEDIIYASILMTDPKLKSIDILLGKFISDYYIVLYNIFKELYEYSCSNESSYNSTDMTLTYRFFYDNIISKSEPLLKVFEDKLEYIDIISLYIKNKKVTSNNYNSVSKLYIGTEIMEYIDKLLDIEMIFLEFCELIFFISRKYFIFYGMNKEEETNTINSNNMNKTVRSVKKGKTKRFNSNKKIEKFDKEEEKTNSENKETKEVKETENYNIILNLIICEKDKLLQKDKYEGINKYTFPVLKTHRMIYEHMENEKKRKIEEEKKERERIRFTNERKLLKDEDINMYREDDEKENTLDSFEEEF